MAQYQQIPAGAYQTPQSGSQPVTSPGGGGGYQQVPASGYQHAPSQQGSYQPPPVITKDEGTQNQTAPSLSSMDQFQGYENTKFQAGTFIPPPAVEPQSLDPGQPTPVNAQIPLISNERPSKKRCGATVAMAGKLLMKWM